MLVCEIKDQPSSASEADDIIHRVMDCASSMNDTTLSAVVLKERTILITASWIIQWRGTKAAFIEQELDAYALWVEWLPISHPFMGTDAHHFTSSSQVSSSSSDVQGTPSAALHPQISLIHFTTRITVFITCFFILHVSIFIPTSNFSNISTEITLLGVPSEPRFSTLQLGSNYRRCGRVILLLRNWLERKS